MQYKDYHTSQVAIKSVIIKDKHRSKSSSSATQVSPIFVMVDTWVTVDDVPKIQDFDCKLAKKNNSKTLFPRLTDLCLLTLLTVFDCPLSSEITVLH